MPLRIEGLDVIRQKYPGFSLKDYPLLRSIRFDSDQFTPDSGTLALIFSASNQQTLLKIQCTGVSKVDVSGITAQTFISGISIDDMSDHQLERAKWHLFDCEGSKVQVYCDSIRIDLFDA